MSPGTSIPLPERFRDELKVEFGLTCEVHPQSVAVMVLHFDARISVLAKKVGLHIFASSTSTLDKNYSADVNNDKEGSVVELGKYSEMSTFKTSQMPGHSQHPKIINFGQDITVYQLQ